MLYIFAALTLPLAALVNAQVPDRFAQVSTSLNIKLQENFDVTRYVGLWYDIFHSKGMPYQNGTDVTANYTLNANGTLVVYNKQWVDGGNTYEAITGIARVIDSSQPARMGVQFPGFPSGGDYRILFTDYDNIALVYSEFQVMGMTIKYGYILARRIYLPSALIDMAFEIFQNRTGLRRDSFEKTEFGKARNNNVVNRVAPAGFTSYYDPRNPQGQSPTSSSGGIPDSVRAMLGGQQSTGGGMPDFVRAMLGGGQGSGEMPDFVKAMLAGGTGSTPATSGTQNAASSPAPPSPGSRFPSVTLTSLEIPLQQNLDKARYMGLWYNIFYTPNMPFQRGSDVTANYTLNVDGSVTVVNREFLLDSKKWNVIRGTARDTTQPSRFVVSFSGFSEGDYRVLYTDYDNIALVYSEFSAFGKTFKYAWYLSRSKYPCEEKVRAGLEIYRAKTGLTRADLKQITFDNFENQADTVVMTAPPDFRGYYTSSPSSRT